MITTSDTNFPRPGTVQELAAIGDHHKGNTALRRPSRACEHHQHKAPVHLTTLARTPVVL
jgi:hypothetical protein